MKKINCILLIDDDEGDNVYHKIIINKANVCNHIKVAVDGLKALEYLAKTADSNNIEEYPHPNVIFLDINMPRMYGFEFLEEYAKLDEKIKSKILIMMLTTSLNPIDHKRAMENKDVTAFENKPLTVEILRDIVEKYFQ